MKHILPIALASCFLLSACAGPAKTGYERTYPAALPRGETLNIQVFRHTLSLELTNTTAFAFGPSTIWLNMWYSRPIEGLAPGETITIPLREFRDEYGQPFYAGGFFATRPPERLVLAELETRSGAEPGPDANRPVLLRLVVVGQTEPQL